MEKLINSFDHRFSHPLTNHIKAGLRLSLKILSQITSNTLAENTSGADQHKSVIDKLLSTLGMKKQMNFQMTVN